MAEGERGEGESAANLRVAPLPFCNIIKKKRGLSCRTEAHISKRSARRRQEDVTRVFLEHTGNISTSPLCSQANPTERRSGHPSRLSCCVYSPLAAHTSWHPAAFENLSGGPRSSQTDPVKHSSGTAVKIVCLNSLPRRCQHTGSTGAEAAQLANFFRATAPSHPPTPTPPPSATS